MREKVLEETVKNPRMLHDFLEYFPLTFAISAENSRQGAKSPRVLWKRGGNEGNTAISMKLVGRFY